MIKKVKKGALHTQLGIPKSKKIPRTLARKIADIEVGKTIKNPTETGEKRIVITKLLKKRVRFNKSLFKE